MTNLTFLFILILITQIRVLAQEAVSETTNGTYSQFYICSEESKNLSTIRLSLNSLTCSERKILALDFERLKSMKFKNQNPYLLKLLGLKEISGKTLLGWLETRVKYLFNSKRNNSEFKINLNQKAILQNNNFDIMDLFRYTRPKMKHREGLIANILGINFATNSGSAIYTSSKINGSIYDFVTPEGEIIPILSPRVGIISVEGLFNIASYPRPEEPLSYVNSLFRIAVLFHEARHSDGHGENLGFNHILCPIGHPYEGQFACDLTLNGAYEIGAAVFSELLTTCDRCTLKDLHFAKIIIQNSRERLIPNYVFPQEQLNTVSESCKETQNEILNLDSAEPFEHLNKVINNACFNGYAAKYSLEPHIATWVDPDAEFISIFQLPEGQSYRDKPILPDKPPF